MINEKIKKNNIDMRILDLCPTNSGLVKQLQEEIPNYITAKFLTEQGVTYESGYLQEVNMTSMRVFGRRNDENYLLKYLTGIVVFD